MSNQTVCPNCQYHNPTGSKFCNNCGEKLPLSTTIICPNCETPNGIDRIFCDNCGTRLVQESPLPEEKPKPQKTEDEEEGPQAFSLPMRRPGETGELNPNLLPEWLRDAPKEQSEPLSEPFEEFEDDELDNKAATDELTRIEHIAAGGDREDELPDWLLDQIDSDPIIPQAEGITTELYLDLVKDDPELANLAELIGDEPEKEDLLSDDAPLPDWLNDTANTAVTQEPDTIETSDDIFADSEDHIESEEDVMAGLTDILTDPTQREGSGIGLTDWLSSPDEEKPPSSELVPDEDDNEPGLTEWLSEAALPKQFDDQPSTTDDNADLGEWLSEAFVDEDALAAKIQSSSSDDDDDGLTDWLSEVFNEDDLPSIPSDAAITNPEDSMADWLKEDSAFGTESSDPLSDELEALMADDEATGVQSDDAEKSKGGLTSWLDNLDELESPAEEQDWLAELPDESDEEAGLTDWLQGLNQLTDSQIEFSSDATQLPEEREDDEDWLAGLADETPQTVDDSDQKPQGSLSVTDWLSDSGPLPSELPDDEEPSTKNLTNDEKMMLNLESTFNADVPDWLADAEQAGEGEDNVAQSELDWMFETGGVDLPDSDEQEEANDFFADLADSGSDLFAEQPDDAAQDNFDDFFADFDQGGDEVVNEQKDDSISDNLDDFFAELDGSDDPFTAQADATDESDSEMPADDQLGWLSDMEDIETGLLDVPEISDSIIDEAQLFDEAEAEQSEQVASVDAEDWEEDAEEFLESPVVSGDIPDWMTALGPPVGEPADEAESALPGLEDSEEMPDWIDQMRPDETDDEGFIGSSLPSILRTDDDLGIGDIDIDDEELPEWFELEQQADAAEANEEIPEWLGDGEASETPSTNDEWNSTLLEQLPPPEGAPSIAAANIPQWLQRFKPIELQDDEEIAAQPENRQDDGEIESVIGGINNIIKVETAILPSIPSNLQTTLTITPAQTNQINILRQLQDEDEEEAEEEGVSTIRIPNLVEFLLVVLILLALTVGWSAPGVLRFIEAPAASATETAAVDSLREISNQTVLVAVEFTPAVSGEMRDQTAVLIQQLTDNNNRIIPVTQHVTAVGVLNELGFGEEEILFIPGEAVGLRLLGDCINSSAEACEVVPQLAEAALTGNVDLILLVAAERDELVNWVEQVTAVSPSSPPLYVSTTNALAPMTGPYRLTDQVDQLFTYQTVVSSEIAEQATQRVLVRQNKAQQLTQIAILLILLGAILYYGLLRPIQDRRSQAA